MVRINIEDSGRKRYRTLSFGIVTGLIVSFIFGNFSAHYFIQARYKKLYFNKILSYMHLESAKHSKYDIEKQGYDKACSFEFSVAPHGLGVSYEITLFYHIGMLRNWHEIVLDQLDTLEQCGLGYMASEMTISFSNPSPNRTENESIQEIQELLNRYHFTTKLSSNITFLNIGVAFPYERPIMERMYSSCRHSNITRIVFYFHNKGCSKFVEDNGTKEFELYSNIFYWRKSMEWFLLERPTLCTRAILKHGALTCGTNLRKFPSMHYSGNFWSASCDYIADLPVEDAWPTRDGDKSYNYISAEMWVGNYTNRAVGDEQKFLTLFNIVANLYKWKATPDQYTWVVSDRTFLQGIHTAEFYDDTWYWESYDPGNQTLLWIDYLSSLEAMINEP
jgi:hypothetical protein